MRLRKIFLLIMLLPFMLFAKEATITSFNKANQIYQKNNYNQALKIYLKLENNQYKNVALYYNIGNCYYKLEDFGRAVLYYEKALHISPKDKDILKNLKLAKIHLQDKEIEVASNPFALFFSWILNFFSVNAYIVISLILFACVGCFGLSFLLFESLRKQWIKQIFVLSLILFLIIGSLASVKIYKTEYQHYGIVTASVTSIMSGPGDNFSLLFTLHSGSKLRIIKKQKDWSLVSMKNGYAGWVKIKDFENI